MPAARPVNAVWTGGTTTVHVGPSRVIEAIHPRAGRRIAAPGHGLADEHRLDFTADRPAAVAELVFHKPRADVSAEVRGLLVVGNTSPRLSCRLAWIVPQGATPRPRGRIFLSAWLFVDRVEIEGIDEPVSWHSEDFPEGGSRIHVTSPSGDFAERSLVLNLSACSPTTLPRGGRGRRGAASGQIGRGQGG